MNREPLYVPLDRSQITLARDNIILKNLYEVTWLCNVFNYGATLFLEPFCFQWFHKKKGGLVWWTCNILRWKKEERSKGQGNQAERITRKGHMQKPQLSPLFPLFDFLFIHSFAIDRLLLPHFFLDVKIPGALLLASPQIPTLLFSLKEEREKRSLQIPRRHANAAAISIQPTRHGFWRTRATQNSQKSFLFKTHTPTRGQITRQLTSKQANKAKLNWVRTPWRFWTAAATTTATAAGVLRRWILAGTGSSAAKTTTTPVEEAIMAAPSASSPPPSPPCPCVSQR